MNCNKCNSGNSSDSKFCSTCGATLKSGPSHEISSGQRSSKWGKFATRSFVALFFTSIMVGFIYTCSIMVEQEFKEAGDTLGFRDPEAARQERCTERLETLQKEPNNLYAIYNLGDVQQDPSGCRDYNSARATFEKVVELYEAKQETSEGDFYAYLDALLALMDLPQANAYDKEQELIERCPGYDVRESHRGPILAPGGTAEEHWLEVSEKQEDINQCVNTILEDFDKKDNENSRIYESKIESVLESLYDENSAYLDAPHTLQEEINQCVNTILEEFDKGVRHAYPECLTQFIR